MVCGDLGKTGALYITKQGAVARLTPEKAMGVSHCGQKAIQGGGNIICSCMLMKPDISTCCMSRGEVILNVFVGGVQPKP